MAGTCPDLEGWLAFYGGETDPAATERMAGHLAACRKCGEEFDRLCLRGAEIAGAPERRPALRPLPRRSGSPWASVAAAAALLAVSVAGLVALAGYRKGSEAPSTVRPPIRVPAPPEVVEPPSPSPPEKPRIAETRPPEPPPLPPPQPRPEPPRPTPPAPAPEPVPVPEPKREAPAPAVQTVVAAATLERASGDVNVVTESGAGTPARAGQALYAGQGVRTAGRGSAAVVAYGDGTRLELGADTTLRRVFARQGAAPGTSARGKSAFVEKGMVAAEVVRQPAGEPLVLATPHGEASVLGTSLRLSVEAASTRVEVKSGRVRMTRSDGAAVEVRSGHFALAGAGSELAARPLPRAILIEDFEDPRGAGARWEVLTDGFPTTTAARIDIDLSPGPAEAYRNGWGVGGGAQTRASFRLPLRVTADVEVTRVDRGMYAALVFVPAPESDEEPFDRLWVERNGDLLGAGWDNGEMKKVPSSGGSPRRERWIAELDAAEIRFLVNDRETLRLKHGRRVTEGYRLRLEANAGDQVPRGTRVRYDNLRIEEVRR